MVSKATPPPITSLKSVHTFTSQATSESMHAMPNNSESYMSISRGNIQFVDSCQHLTDSLNNLEETVDVRICTPRLGPPGSHRACLLRSPRGATRTQHTLPANRPHSSLSAPSRQHRRAGLPPQHMLTTFIGHAHTQTCMANAYILCLSCTARTHLFTAIFSHARNVHHSHASFSFPTRAVVAWCTPRRTCRRVTL